MPNKFRSVIIVYVDKRITLVGWLLLMDRSSELWSGNRMMGRWSLVWSRRPGHPQSMSLCIYAHMLRLQQRGHYAPVPDCSYAFWKCATLWNQMPLLTCIPPTAEAHKPVTIHEKLAALLLCIIKLNATAVNSTLFIDRNIGPGFLLKIRLTNVFLRIVYFVFQFYSVTINKRK